MSSTPIYAIGDIHGHRDKLENALDLIARDGGRDAEIVFLGDLVDRGPDGRGVIETLMVGQAAGRRWHVVKGNHDQLFARFLSEGMVDHARILSRKTWLDPKLGGATTLASYGVIAEESSRPGDLHASALKAVPWDHIDFLENLPNYLIRGDLLFVHAGIAPGIALAEQCPDDFQWIRQPFLEFSGSHPWLVVHGHTAIEMPHHYGNRVNLDGGAGHGRDLWPAVFEGRDCWLLTEGGRLRLAP